jgi:hypothetical protein
MRWQLRKIVPSQTALALIIHNGHSYALILSCVIWTLLSPSSYYKASIDPKMSKKVLIHFCSHEYYFSITVFSSMGFALVPLIWYSVPLIFTFYSDVSKVKM